jgi:serine/threonine protein kinase
MFSHRYPTFDYVLDPSDADWTTAKFSGAGAYGSVATVYWRKFGRHVAVKMTTMASRAIGSIGDRRLAHEDVSRASRAYTEVAYGVKYGSQIEQMVEYHGWFVRGNTLGVVMERLDFDLSAVAKGKRKLSTRDMARVLSDTAEGLTKLHRMGYVHRDIKPHNLMVTSSPSSGRNKRGKIIDWAFTAPIGARLPGAGSETYMPPSVRHSIVERVGYDYVNGETDVYALGMTVLYLARTAMGIPSDIVDLAADAVRMSGGDPGEVISRDALNSKRSGRKRATREELGEWRPTIDFFRDFAESASFVTRGGVEDNGSPTRHHHHHRLQIHDDDDDDDDDAVLFDDGGEEEDQSPYYNNNNNDDEDEGGPATRLRGRRGKGTSPPPPPATRGRMVPIRKALSPPPSRKPNPKPKPRKTAAIEDTVASRRPLRQARARLVHR